MFYLIPDKRSERYPTEIYSRLSGNLEITPKSYRMILFRPYYLAILLSLSRIDGFALAKTPSCKKLTSATRFQATQLSAAPIHAGILASTTAPIGEVEKEKNIRGKAALALTALLVQNSALALLMRLSRVTRKSSSSLYIVSTAVVLSEFIKVVVSLLGCFFEDAGKDIEVVWKTIQNSSKSTDLLKISIPAALYVLQNNLQYVAMSNLPAEVYQVLIQGKIITTAIFSVILLNKRYSVMQWASVFGLSIGVALVQFSLHASIVTASHVNFAVGISSVIVSTLTSGFASIFLEKMLKSKGGFWVRNVQLSFVSLMIASIGSIAKDTGPIINRGFFAGYNPLVLSVILTQALGGMLVAFVVRYTNSIVKGFAASGSIVLSCIISAIFLSDYKLNRMFLIGTAMVCASAFAWAISPQPIVTTVAKEIVSEKSRKLEVDLVGFNDVTVTGVLKSDDRISLEEVPELVGVSRDFESFPVMSIEEPNQL